MFTEPLGGWRRAAVTDRRTKVDWALQVRELLDVDYPEAKRVTLVADNLNTHTYASLSVLPLGYWWCRFPPAACTMPKTRSGAGWHSC